MSTNRKSLIKNKNILQSAYSILFLSVFFAIMAWQLFVLGMAFNSTFDSKNYSWEKSLVGQYRGFKYQIGDRVFRSAVVGKDGWLFFTENLSLRNYQKVDPLNVTNIKKLLNIFRQIDERVSAYGGTFLVVVPPDKSTIYPQYMPKEIPVIGTVTSLDRLIERVNNFSHIRIVDLRPTLRSASESTPVYYKTDTHWNCIGAFYAYNEMLSSIKMSNPDLKIHSMDDFTITTHETRFDLASTMGIDLTEESMSVSPNFDVEITSASGIEQGYNNDLLRFVFNSNRDLPELMVLHDSFYPACLNSYVETSFSRTLSVPYNDITMEQILEVIEVEKPDVVVLEFAERFMDYFLWQFAE
ncbi:MAG: hypothetical protein HYZ22_17500 [Chloroflexi bacterium]|nr:hypothetical protein [Chloroflexota bacterium]